MSTIFGRDTRPRLGAIKPSTIERQLYVSFHHKLISKNCHPYQKGDKMIRTMQIEFCIHNNKKLLFVFIQIISSISLYAISPPTFIQIFSVR